MGLLARKTQTPGLYPLREKRGVRCKLLRMGIQVASIPPGEEKGGVDGAVGPRLHPKSGGGGGRKF